VFSTIYVALRERHDDFADQTDAAGIGATRYEAHWLASAGFLAFTA
jgi:hypothetical protein